MTSIWGGTLRRLIGVGLGVAIATWGAAVVVRAGAAAGGSIDWDAGIYVKHLVVYPTARGVCAVDTLYSYPVGVSDEGVVWGHLNLVGDADFRPNGDILIRGNGHTVVVRVGSPVAVVDGEYVVLEGAVYDPPFDPTEGPLTRLGKILGYRFLVGRYTSHEGVYRGQFAWVMRVRAGLRIPTAILRAQRILTAPRGWLLLRHDTDRGDGPGCGVVTPMSEALIASPDGPWGDTRVVARELRWRVQWSAARRSGTIRSRTAVVPVRMVSRAGGMAVVVGRREYRLPQVLLARARRGQPLFPVEPVANALGWLYGDVVREKGVSWITPPWP